MNVNLDVIKPKLKDIIIDSIKMLDKYFINLRINLKSEDVKPNEKEINKNINVILYVIDYK